MSLVIDLGLKSIDIEDEKGNVIGSYEYLPTDSGIVKRFEDFQKWIETTDWETDEDLNRLNNEIREQFSKFLGAGNGESIFAKYEPMTLIANGDFFFEIMIDSIVDDIEKEMDIRVKKKQKRIKEMTKAAKKFN